MSSIYNKVMQKMAKEAKQQNKPSFKSPVVLGEFASSLPGDFASSAVGIPSQAIGRIVGLLTPDATEKDVGTYNYVSFFPGAGAYRSIKRNQLLDKKYSKGKRRNSAMVSEYFGGLPTMLATAAIGGILGHIADRKKLFGEDSAPDIGLIGGLGIGAGIGGASEAVSYLTGLLRPKTKKEHEDYLSDDKLVAKNLLIPFRGTHNAGRRVRSLLSETL